MLKNVLRPCLQRGQEPIQNTELLKSEDRRCTCCVIVDRFNAFTTMPTCLALSTWSTRAHLVICVALSFLWICLYKARIAS